MDSSKKEKKVIPINMEPPHVDKKEKHSSKVMTLAEYHKMYYPIYNQTYHNKQKSDEAEKIEE